MIIVIVIVIENIYAYAIGNCSLDFVVVLGKPLNSINSAQLYFVSCYQTYHLQLGKSKL